MISIHAPTRGATRADYNVCPYFVFQSTLPREERRLRTAINEPILKFQSTLPREERLIRHTFSVLRSYFNPRSHERSDFLRKSVSFLCFRFQSTLPREERPDRHDQTDICCIFQSTLPREERQQYCTKNLFIFIQYRQ